MLLQLSFTIKWKKKEKLSNRLTAAILKDLRFKNMECSASAHICDRRGGIVEANSFLAKKKKTVSLMDSTCVFFCRMTVLPVFNLTHFDWLPAHFRKCSDAQLLAHFLIALTLLSSRCNFSCQISILNEFHIESEARWLFYIPILNLTFTQASSFVTVHDN